MFHSVNEECLTTNTYRCTKNLRAAVPRVRNFNGWAVGKHQKVTQNYKQKTNKSSSLYLTTSLERHRPSLSLQFIDVDVIVMTTKGYMTSI